MKLSKKLLQIDRCGVPKLIVNVQIYQTNCNEPDRRRFADDFNGEFIDCVFFSIGVFYDWFRSS